ncbi:Aminomethyltransferase [Roseomonas mucosa]|uniref:aminomethyltransferase n=2 Tax=Roseomonas mucosa TaxID=207340 RepID=A0A4Y1N2W0_9PROT|nr:Aminomethyltransferase [Roseomonas mucosa]
MADAAETMLETPLADWHRAQGARMVPFAGYMMPVQYPAGIIAEHKACREGAALFDVSHMGQAELRGEGAAAALEALTPADVQGLKPGRQRYGVLMTEAGGILDDFMFTNLGDRMFLVLNASRKAVDEAAIAAILPPSVTLAPMPDRALLALQGPEAERILATLAPEVAALPFMGVAEVTLAGGPALVSRSGYTGEDGYEISVPAENATKLAGALVTAGAAPAGLGARDSLRLEAGLCLYGNDLDETTSPVEAALNWTIGKRRCTEWNFRGAERVREELDHGPKRLRVGFAVEGRQPARAHTPIQSGAEVVGEVTSGGFGPTLGAPVAMGYVRPDLATDGTALDLMVRGKAVAAKVAPTPFVPHRYKRASRA